MLHAHGHVNGLFGNGERLEQNADGFEFRGHPHDVLLAVHDELGLETIEAANAAFGVGLRCGTCQDDSSDSLCICRNRAEP